MNLSTHLHRSLLALPLLAIAVAAATREPPQIKETVRAALASGLSCGEASRPAGMLGLARMPGDLGQLSRRLSCDA